MKRWRNPMARELKFSHLRLATVARCEQSFFPLEAWSPAEWACALAGEVGEACNLIKKLKRGDFKGLGAKLGARKAIADEIADTVIYADLLAARLGIDLGEAIRRKFNRTSEKVRSKVKL